jgi:hypothetical protein
MGSRQSIGDWVAGASLLCPAVDATLASIAQSSTERPVIERTWGLEGRRDKVGILGIFARGRLGGDGLFLSTGSVVSFDKQEFFKKQIEECRELESQAPNVEDREFWWQAAERREQQLWRVRSGKF